MLFYKLNRKMREKKTKEGREKEREREGNKICHQTKRKFK